MPNPICEIHNIEAIVKPAGTSKATGKPYNAFYACPDKTNGYCQFKFTQRPPVAGFGEARVAHATNSADKDRAIKYMNALKIASELMAAGTIPVGPDWKVSLETAAQYVFNLNAPADASQVPF